MFFMMLFFFASFQQQCEIPWWVYIQNAQDPCWTMERLRSQYKEAEEDVYFSRWLTDKPFSRIDLDSKTIQLIVIEHSDIFNIGNFSAI